MATVNGRRHARITPVPTDHNEDAIFLLEPTLRRGPVPEVRSLMRCYEAAAEKAERGLTQMPLEPRDVRCPCLMILQWT